MEETPKQNPPTASEPPPAADPTTGPQASGEPIRVDQLPHPAPDAETAPPGEFPRRLLGDPRGRGGQGVPVPHQPGEPGARAPSLRREAAALLPRRAGDAGDHRLQAAPDTTGDRADPRR